METHLLIGNLFSFLSSLCIVISAAQKSKKDLIKWQTFNIVFYMIACVALHAYAALVSIFIGFVRNILSYKDRLTKNITGVLCLLIVIVGLLANNRGIIGIFPIVAIVSYTVFIYTTKNEQQMRYALVLNMMLWFVHNFWIMAYPSAITNILICLWTLFQIFKNKKPLVLRLEQNRRKKRSCQCFLL